MRVYLYLFSCFAIFLLTSCHTSRKATAHHSRTPKFIDDIYMDRHNKNCATAECIDKAAKYPDRKYPERRWTNRKSSGEKSVAATNNEGRKETTPHLDISRTEARGLKEKYAAILGINPKDIANVPLFQFIDEWYGVEYHMGGEDKTGIDCSGFTRKLYEAIYGMDLVHSSHELYNNCQHLKNISKAEEGDLVFFKTHGRRISHVGVYLTNDYFVHASTSQGVVISSLKEEYWQKHFVASGKINKP